MGNRCDISEEFYIATFGTLLALEVVVILLLLSKVERERELRGRDNNASAAALSVLQVAVASEFCQVELAVGRRAQAVADHGGHVPRGLGHRVVGCDAALCDQVHARTAPRGDSGRDLGDNKPDCAARGLARDAHDGMAALPVDVVLTVELIQVLRLVRTVSKALVRAIFESVPSGSAHSHSGKLLEALAFRIKVMMYCYYVVLVAATYSSSPCLLRGDIWILAAHHAELRDRCLGDTVPQSRPLCDGAPRGSQQEQSSASF
jgi:hypothetical protein